MKMTRLCSLVAILLLALLAGCNPSHDISGAWVGTLDAGHLKLRLVFHIKRQGGGYEATIDTIDQGRKNLPVSAVRIKGPEVHFELDAFSAVYDAKLDTTGTEMVGLFRQAGANIPFNLKKTAHPPIIPPRLLPASYTPHAGSELQGYWQGTLSIGTVQTHIGFKIAEPAKGKYRAELDSIDQGATGIPVTAVSYQPPSVHLEIAGVAGTFNGTFTHADEINGTWKQGPNSIPVILKRTAPPTGRHPRSGTQDQ